MSEAGKDANARPEQAGDSLPVRTLARVAPQSVQLAKDHALLGRSAWCGLVCALAAVVTVVNFLPPAGVAYKVTTQIQVSPKRYETLKQELKKSAPSSAEATLLDVKLLDDGSQRRVNPSETQLLLEVSSQWPRRTTAPRVHKWLSSISTVNEHAVAHVEAAKVQRFARWEVQTREHYLKQYKSELLAKKIASSDTALAESSPTKFPNNIKLASTPNKPRVKFATLGEPSGNAVTNDTPVDTPLDTGADSANNLLELDGPSATEDTSPSDEFEKQLQSELDAAKKAEQDVSGEVAHQAVQASGKLTLIQAGRVSAIPERLPRNQVLSIFVLALAMGALGGWVNHRAQSGGTFRAVDVGHNLQLLGLPVLGNVHLPTSDLAGIEGEVTRRFVDVRRWLMQQCLALAELVVLFWCLAILIRMILDPLWRGLVWENPLAGLARLFVGLP